MGISEMRLPANGQCVIENHKPYYFRNENNRCNYGVGLIASRRIQKHIVNFKPM